jgi:probable HAF family extracellular repeat protein
VDFPNAGLTVATGVNNAGDVVGIFGSSTSNGGFVLSSGVYTAITFPGAFAFPDGINNRGQIVGALFHNLSSLDSGFLLQDGVFTTFAFPGSSSGSFATGINDAGEIVGTYFDSEGLHQSFVYSDGEFRTISFPGAAQTGISGINDRGDMVGFYFLAENPYVQHNFIARQGRFEEIVVPGCVTNGSAILGINKFGNIVGYCGDEKTRTTHGFVRSRGRFVFFDFPGAVQTEAFGINDAGQIVGYYLNSGSPATQHGFIATPQK